MAIHYVCRHCRSAIGVLDSSAVTERQLGLHFLTPDERQDIIAYNPDGGITVTVICEFCRDALCDNPELSLLSNPLQ